MPLSLSRSQAEDLDRSDPLASFRHRFVIEDEDLIYVDGNSLGRLPKATIERIQEVVNKEWGSALVTGWDEWIHLAERIGDKIGTGLLGAARGEVIVSDSTTVNLYKLAVAAAGARPGRKAIVTDVDNFPSDRYVMEALADRLDLELRWITGDPIEGPSPATIQEALDGEVAFACLQHVAYRSGAVADMAAITQMVHDAGALMIWDLCHSVGAVPVDLGGCGADLAVGCTYKYLNGGPGSPAFLYVRRDLQEELRQPIWGWFGQTEQFAMGPRYEPAEGPAKFLTGTPPIVSMAAIETGVDLILEAGIDALREKSVRMTEMMIGLFDQWLAPLGFSLGTPRDASRRGSHFSLQHEDARRINTILIEQCRVIPDFREPDVIRFGVAPIYTRFSEAWDAIDRLRAAVE